MDARGGRNAVLAQREERRFEKPEGRGSIPRGGTTTLVVIHRRLDVASCMDRDDRCEATGYIMARAPRAHLGIRRFESGPRHRRGSSVSSPAARGFSIRHAHLASSMGEHLSYKQGTAVRFCGWVRTPMRRVGILRLLIDRPRVRVPPRLRPGSSAGRAIKRKPYSTSDSSNPCSRCLLGLKHCRRCSGLLPRRTRFDSLWSYQRRCAETRYFV